MEVVEIPSSCIPNFARGLNILLVDDDTASLMYLASLLEQHSYKVTTTRLASAALSMIREEEDKFKLVMVNVDVPKMDGLKFIRDLFKKKVPVIAISAERSVRTACKAMKAGATLCLDKPISLYDLKYLWQYVFEKTAVCRVKLNMRMISQSKVVRDEGRKAEVPDGIVLQEAASYQNATAPCSEGKGQVVGFKDLDATNRQQMIAGLEVEVLDDGANSQQMKADPKGNGLQIEGEIIFNGTIDDKQMIIPDANPGDKGKQVNAQVLHRINNYNQPMTQLKTQGRKNGVQQVAIVKQAFTKEAEITGIEMSVVAEIQKQDDQPVINRSQQQSRSKRPTDGGEERRNKERRVEANSEIISCDKKINLEKQKEIERSKGEETTERFENNINTNSSTGKRHRLIWNQDLQMKFMSAISALGDQKARPKKILEMMNVSGVSQRQVSSHLQKYKAQIRRIYDHATTDSSPLNEPSLLEKTGSVRVPVGNQGSEHGIEGDKSEILKAPTDGVHQDIFFPCLSGNRNNAPLMSAGTSQGQQGYGGEHFTIKKVAHAIKLATTFTGRNRKLDFITPPNPTSGNVPDAIKFPAISTDENRNLDPKVSNPNPDKLTNTDEFIKDLNEVIQELDAIAVTSPPSGSLNQSQSLSDFTRKLNLLEEEPVNSNGLNDEPSPDEVARYLDSLSEFLLGKDSPQP